MKRNIATTMALAIGLTVVPQAISTSAFASTPENPSEIVEQAAPTVLVNLDPESGVNLPTDSSGEIVVYLGNSAPLAITLPDAEIQLSQAGDGFSPGEAETDPNGVVFYENSDGGVTVPVPQEGGGIAIHTIIEERSAPTDYVYSLSFPDDVVARQVDGEGILFTTREGAYLGAIASPWAKDADGKAVPTHFEFDGSQLTQVVNHDLGQFSYPIVADPYFGIALHSSVWWSGSGSSRKASLNTTPQMGVAWAAGAAYSYGWPEALSKLGNELNKETYRQQYKCHADNAPLVLAGGAFGFGNTWDLEYSRGTNSDYGNVWYHRCNW